MLSFYQAYQAYERRRMRGEWDVARPHPQASLGATLALRLAALLLIASQAIYRRYAPTQTISRMPPSSQEQL